MLLPHVYKWVFSSDRETLFSSDGDIIKALNNSRLCTQQTGSLFIYSSGLYFNSDNPSRKTYAYESSLLCSTFISSCEVCFLAIKQILGYERFIICFPREGNLKVQWRLGIIRCAKHELYFPVGCSILISGWLMRK